MTAAEAAVIIAQCATSVLFWLMMPMGMYVVCKLFQEKRQSEAISILCLFCCYAIGHFMAVSALSEHGFRWGAHTIGWLYPCSCTCLVLRSCCSLCWC